MFNEKFEKCLITFLPVRLITLKNMYGPKKGKGIQKEQKGPKMSRRDPNSAKGTYKEQKGPKKSKRDIK